MIAAAKPVPRISLALFLSGAAGLGFQIVWTRQSSAGLGHELSAALALITAFMIGLSAGAFCGGWLMSKARSEKKFYALLEAVIGSWGILSIWLIPLASQLARNWIGTAPSGFGYWAKAFTLNCLAILPATFAMGAAMVAAHRVIRTHAKGEKIGFIYAINTFGGMAGCLAAAYLLLGWLGFAKTLVLLSTLNFVAAILAWSLPADEKSGGHSSASIQKEPNALAPLPSPQPSPRGRGSRMGVGAGSGLQASRLPPKIVLFFTGFFGIGYEILGVRVLSHSLENTIYTFASTLAVYLLGTAAGSAFVDRRAANKSKEPVANWFIPMSASILVGGLALLISPKLYTWARQALGDTPLAVCFAETLVASAVFLLPTFCMGALFTQFAQLGMQRGASAGQLFGINSLGSALGPIVLGIILFPLIGSKWCLILIAAGYLGMSGKWNMQAWGTAAAIAAMAAALPAKLTHLDLPPGATIFAQKEGAMATVSVIQTLDGHRVLKVNNRFQMGGTAAAVAEQRHADIPLLLHGRAKSALFLGLGTGITFATATNYPGLHADGVEINPQVTELMPAFFKPPALPPSSLPNLRVFTGDARRFADQLPDRYDVIVADLFHPAQDGAGFLYTVEHYQTLKARLQPDGLICQWLPLYQMNEETFRTIAASFLQVFPNAEAWMLRFNVDTPVAGLISMAPGLKLSPNWVEQQLKPIGSDSLEDHLKKVSLANTIRLVGCLLAGNAELVSYAGKSALNTDDFPRVIFNAPAHAYRKAEKNYATLFSLLERFRGDPSNLFPVSENADFNLRARLFIQARNIYLKGLAHEFEGKVLPAVDLYIESARVSEDFTLGYAQGITIAAALAQPNPKAARELLNRLDAAQPSRGVAREMLRRLQ